MQFNTRQFGKVEVEKNMYANKQTYHIEKQLFKDNGIALELVGTGKKEGTPIAMLTCNIEGSVLRPGEFCVKGWSENERIIEDARNSGLFVDTGKRIQTGHCYAEVWRLA